jgi:hypothetical protein
MATIALRVPTTRTGIAHPLPNGQCYILFERGFCTAELLIKEKVRAEARKANAGGVQTCSLPELLGREPDELIAFGPQSVASYEMHAIKRFNNRDYLLFVDGIQILSPGQVVELSRTTSITFELPKVEAVECTA